MLSLFSFRAKCRVAALLWVAGLVLLPSGGFAAGEAAAKDWTRHTEEVIFTVHSLLSHVTEVESAQGGYAINGQKSYLEPFQPAPAPPVREIAPAFTGEAQL